MFEITARRILFRLPMPDRNAREFTHTPTRRVRRSPTATSEAYEQESGDLPALLPGSSS